MLYKVAVRKIIKPNSLQHCDSLQERSDAHGGQLTFTAGIYAARTYRIR